MWAFRIRQGRLLLSVDVANVFNRQAVTGYDQDTDRSSGLDNPDFGKRTSYQDPRQVRLGICLEM